MYNFAKIDLKFSTDDNKISSRKSSKELNLRELKLPKMFGLIGSKSKSYFLNCGPESIIMLKEMNVKK